MRGNKSPRAWVDWLLIATFLAAIGLPGSFHLLTADDDLGVRQENRTPARAPRPVASLDDLRAFPAAFQSYFDDSFRGRVTWLRYYNALWLLGLHTSPHESFVRGLDGYLFTTFHDAIAQHRGLRPLTASERATIEDVLRRRVDLMASLGSRYVVVVGPDKHSIHPERLPEWARDSHGPTPMDELLDIARGVEGALVVDLRAVLREAAKNERVYYPYGTHWNQLGAFYAYREIMAVLRDEGVPVTALDLEAFRVEEANLLADSWGGAIHLEDALVQPGFEIEPRDPVEFEEFGSSYPGLDKVFRRIGGVAREGLHFTWHADSFGEALLPYLQLHAAWVYKGNRYRFDPTLATVVRPDVCFHVIVERNIRSPGFRELPDEIAFFQQSAVSESEGRDLHLGDYTNPVHGQVRLEREHEVASVVQGRQVVPLEMVGAFLYRFRWKGPPTFALLQEGERGRSRSVTILDRDTFQCVSFVRVPVQSNVTLDRWCGAYRVGNGLWHVSRCGERQLALFTELGDLLGILAERSPDRFVLVETERKGGVAFRSTPEGGARASFELDGIRREGIRE
ncbi:MAG: hypothetical protein H6834_11960 [Planctomycetes bacterium]|nr:hypothetical protein [Planctomycetota bacterium]